MNNEVDEANKINEIVDLHQLFETSPDDCLDVAVLMKLEESGFIYLEKCLEKYNNILKEHFKLSTKPIEQQTEFASEFISYFNVYFGIYINDHSEDFLEYINDTPETKLWIHYNNTNANMLHIMQLVDSVTKRNHKINKFKLINKLFENLETSKYLSELFNQWLAYGDNENVPEQEETTGRQYELHSAFSLFTMINITNIEQYKDMLKCFMKIYQSQKIDKLQILNCMYKVLESNIYYTHINIEYETLSLCSSTNFIATLMFICFELYKTEEKFCTSKINPNKLDRSDFEIYPEDDYQTNLFYLTNYCIYVCFTPLFATKNSLKKSLESYALFGSLFFGSANRQAQLEYELNSLDDLISHPHINNTIMELYENMATIIENNIDTEQQGSGKIITDSIMYSIYNYFSNMLNEFKVDFFADIIFKLFENVINGKYYSNPHIRFQFASLLFNLSRSPTNVSINSLETLITYYLEVDYKNWTQYALADKHTTQFIGSFSKCYSLVNYTFDFTNQANKSFVYKLCSVGISDCSIMVDLCNEFIKVITKRHILESADEYSRLIESISKPSKPIMSKMNRIHSLIMLLVHSNIDEKTTKFENISNELFSQIIIFVIDMLKFSINPIFCKINEKLGGAYYDKNLQFESFDILLKQNNPFIIGQISQIYDLHQGSTDYIKLVFDQTPSIINAITEYKYNRMNKEKIIVYPEEFLDPILYTKITDPIMIPDVTSILDKSSIIRHLYTSKTNPFTQQPLTENEITEYNKQPDVIIKINEFNQKLTKFEENYA
jgi:hypothetical protein